MPQPSAGDQRADFLRGDHLVEARALDVQDLALERQDGLGATVPALLGRATGAVTLDDEDLGERGILLLAVGELAGKTCDIEGSLAARHLARLAGGFAGTGGIEDLADDGLGLGGVLEQELGELLGDAGLDRPLHLRRHELVLGLRGELRIGQLHGEDRGETFARVIASGLDLLLLGFLLDVVVQRARERGAEARQMRTAIALRDVVGVAEHRLLVGVVPLHRHFDADVAFLRGEPEHVGVDRRARTVEVTHERLESAFVLEHVMLVVALIGDLDADAGIEEREFAQPLREDLVVEHDVREDRRRRTEAHPCAAFGGGAGVRERRDRIAEAILLRVELAVAVHGEVEHIGQRIDDRHADAMQTAGDLVGAVIELTAGMQHGHDDLGCRATFFGMDVDGNAATVVAHRDGFIGVNDDFDFGAVTGERFVDRVVDDFEHHVVEAGAVIGITDVHAGALANRIEPLQNLDFAGIVDLIVSHHQPRCCTLLLYTLSRGLVRGVVARNLLRRIKLPSPSLVPRGTPARVVQTARDPDRAT